ncbi:MAG: AbrB family transcriptional regulator [Aeriscardovia sp.]|nr:AbrB family transcriptional regulator [Aeriscardovia sp.]
METGKTLTDDYERIRKSTDSQELSRLAREKVSKEEVGEEEFAIKSALLEAVAANPSTPLEDRIYMASSSSFPNILVRLSRDADPGVRRAVAANTASKNWLLSKLAKDGEREVREAALENPKSSWKAKLDGAQDPSSSPELLCFLSQVGKDAPEGGRDFVLASMIRSSVARNSSCPPDVLSSLAEDPSPEVAKAASRRVSRDNVQ